MKRIIVSIVLALVAVVSYAQVAQNLPEGVMTLDRRSGKLSINGMNVAKNSTYLYLSPEAESLYKSGDTISSIGDILMGGSAGFAAGWLTSSLILGDKRVNKKADAPVYITCGAIFLVGLPLHFVGLNRINKAIADYNTRHGFTAKSPQLSMGVQQNGLGLSLQF